MIVHSQPAFHPRPVGISESGYSAHGRRPQAVIRKSFGSSRTSLTGQSRFWSDGSTRRPLISAPSDFRHVQSGSSQFESDLYSSSNQSVSRPSHRTSDDLTTRRTYSRPPELSIRMPDHRVSPLLPQFELPKIYTPPHPPAYCAESSEQNHNLCRERSYSSMSFHIPRRQVGGSPSASRDDSVPPRIPAKSKYRTRAYTAPEVDAIKERVASALIEVEILQKQIDDVIERQSVYISSRPSTSHSMARTMPELEPMPSIPALPPEAPSFAERLNADIDRPQTAPIRAMRPVTGSRRGLVHNEKEGSKPSVHRSCDDRSSPPLLPLVFRPPLRKKKSFSRVSTWLFPGHERVKNASAELITNKPRPVKGNNGFYQIMSPNGPNASYESFDSISTWYTEDEDRTAPTI